MIRFGSDNKQALSPNFVSLALHGVTHRFVLVLECETRMYNDSRRGQVIAPPRFAIGGARATLDPRNARVAELLPLAKHKLELPAGWERIHQYIYVLQPTTDEHGWQYRSEWSDGPITEDDEQWVKANSPGLDVRRRLWMITVVKRDDVVTAKRKLSEALVQRPRQVIMEGELYRQEQGALMKTWPKRYVILYDDCIEVFSGGAPDSGGKKISEIAITDCDAKMLFGVQCPGREFAFSVRQINGPVVALFDAENREIRRRWVVAIRYQLAVLCPEVNFPPFDYGPPVSDESAPRILMCGELSKQGQMVGGWKNRFFQLNPTELQYFEKENPKGYYLLKGAVVSSDDKSLDFSLKTSSGKVVSMRADNAANKATWVRAISRQIIVENSIGEDEGDDSIRPSAQTIEIPAEVPIEEGVEEEDDDEEDEGEDSEENDIVGEADAEPEKDDTDSDLGELEGDSDSDIDQTIVPKKSEVIEELLVEDSESAAPDVSCEAETNSTNRAGDSTANESSGNASDPTDIIFEVTSVTEAVDATADESSGNTDLLPDMIRSTIESNDLSLALASEETHSADHMAVDSSGLQFAESNDIELRKSQDTRDSLAPNHDIETPEPLVALDLNQHLASEVDEIVDVSLGTEGHETVIDGNTVTSNLSDRKLGPNLRVSTEDSEQETSTRTVSAWTLKAKKSSGNESTPATSVISPSSKARPAFIDPTASKASRYAAMMAERAAAETEEGWGSATMLSPQIPEEIQAAALDDPSRISPRRHSYIPTKQGPVIPKAADPVKTVSLRPASQRKLSDQKEEDFGQDPESARIELTPHVAKIKQKIARKPSMVMSRILNLETKIAETAIESPGNLKK